MRNGRDLYIRAVRFKVKADCRGLVPYSYCEKRFGVFRIQTVKFLIHINKGLHHARH
jgi:hypothetical protein